LEATFIQSVELEEEAVPEIVQLYVWWAAANAEHMLALLHQFEFGYEAVLSKQASLLPAL